MASALWCVQLMRKSYACFAAESVPVVYSSYVLHEWHQHCGMCNSCALCCDVCRSNVTAASSASASAAAAVPPVGAGLSRAPRMQPRRLSGNWKAFDLTAVPIDETDPSTGKPAVLSCVASLQHSLHTSATLRQQTLSISGPSLPSPPSPSPHGPPSPLPHVNPVVALCHSEHGGVWVFVAQKPGAGKPAKHFESQPN